MGSDSKHTDLLGAINAAVRRVVVVTGGAGSGKTAAALGVYEQYLTEPAEPGCAILAPNYLTCQWLRGRLLSRQESGVLVSPQVMTFAALAGAIVTAAGATAEPISPVRRRAVLEGIIADLAANKGLAAVGRLADTPGLVQSVDRSISELKRGAIEPEVFGAALGVDGSAKHRDLLAIYRAYQGYLHERGLYDEEGRMWQAREELAAMAGVPLPHLRAVVADGFTDFTPTQLAILKLLSERVERLVITLPFDGADGRTKLWHWTGRQLERIQATFGDSCERVHAPASADVAAGGLLGAVFAVEPDPVEWPEGLSCVEAADPESECRAIARWAKRMLASGVRPDELAVVGRRTSDFDATLHRVFREAGLAPTRHERPLAATPAGRMLAATVAMADGFDAADVLRVLGSSYLDVSRLGAFDSRARAAAQLIIRHQNVLGGRDRYGPAATRMGERVARWAASGDNSFATPQQKYLAELGPETVAAGGELLEALLGCVDPLAAGGTPAEMAAACRGLLDTIVLPGVAVTTDPSADSVRHSREGCRGLRNEVTQPRDVEGRGCSALRRSPRHPESDVSSTYIDSDDDELVADDLRTWSALRGVLDDLAATADAPGAARRVTAGRFGDLLSALLAETPAQPVVAATAIPAIGALDIRAVRALHVWLVGLNEGAFPAAATDSPLIAEADRQRWAEHHALDLDLKDDLVAREMLLLYLAISRADDGLVVSWHAADSGGHAAAASGFLDALLAATDPSTRKITKLPPAEFAPPGERIVSARELRNAAMAAAADQDAGETVAWREALRRGVLAPLARPLWAANRRWVPEVLDRYDGVLDDPAAVGEFAKRIPAEVVLSVSQINTYLDCPWRWFAERALKLEELPAPSDELVPRRRGQLVHAVLRRMFAALTVGGDVPVTSLGSTDTLAALDAAIDDEAAAVAGLVQCRGLWDSELRRLRRDLVAYMEHQVSSALPDERVSKQELAFGMAVTSDRDPASTPDPLVLDGPAGPVRLRGLIDRVDWVSVGDQAKAFVIDYKTGSLPDPKTDAQLPVYIKAVEQILGRPSAGGGFQAVGGSGPREKYLAEVLRARGKVKTDEEFPAKLDAGLGNLHAAVAGMAAGRFGLADAHGCAGVWCPLRRICGFSEARARLKNPDAQEGDDE